MSARTEAVSLKKTVLRKSAALQAQHEAEIARIREESEHTSRVTRAAGELQDMQQEKGKIAPVSPLHCTAFGEGLHQAEATADADFVVETRTMYGHIQSLPKVGELSVEFLLLMPALRPQLGMEVEKHAREPAKGLRVIKVAQMGAAARASIQVQHPAG